MSGIKQFIYDQQNDLEDEIHPREHRCVHVQEILANDANFAHLRMMAEMQPPTITLLDRLRDWLVALFKPAKRAAEWVTGYEDPDEIPF